MNIEFEKYIAALRRTPLDEKTEHTDRGALEMLLQAFASKQNKHNQVVHEPGRQGDKGAPDYKVRQAGQIIGYVENKKIDDDLTRVAKGAQIARYAKLSGNILLTDYLQFVWIRDGKIAERAVLAYSEELLKKGGPAEARIAEVAKLLEGFFSTPPEGIGRSQQLALALATRARLLRDDLTVELVRQQKEHHEGRLFGLYQVFKSQVFHELTLKEFADAFAQMLAYGLFLARLNSGASVVTLENAKQYVPTSFELIRELVNFLDELSKGEYREVRWVVDEIASIVNGLNLAAIHEDLSFRQRKAINRNMRAGDEEEHRLFERDPFIYFYEDFLKAYDPEIREGRGVYYTPPPVVNFIVRAIDDVLKDADTFNLSDGLADNKNVTVLDFACGTGTFLLEVFQQVFANIGGPDVGKADPMVRQHLLRNIFGFEYLIAPYTIAHLKLSQYLAEQKHPLREGERLKVYLTNTLEPIEPQKNFLLPAVTAEVEAAQEVKDRPILVITGNPPYSGVSRNTGRWITDAIEPYKYVDGEHFRERKHWLLDDYVKFIRFAQMKMEAVDRGIVAVITNHAWIYNPTFRGMRQSLQQTFNRIYIVDLHGSSKPREHAPNGFANENVFEIQKGVAVALFVKSPGLEPEVRFGEIWGRRLEKYKTVASADLMSIADVIVQPASPFYFFAPHRAFGGSEWSTYVPLTEIFPFQSAGMLTARDRLNVHFEPEELKNTIRKFVGMTAPEARSAFALGPDTRDWKVATAQADASQFKDDAGIRRVAYRPFDIRYVFYTGQSKGLIGQPARALAEAIDAGGIALEVTRRVEEGQFRHALAVSSLPDGHSVSSKETTHVLPLFKAGGGENLSPVFRSLLATKYSHHYSAEEIFGYVYAVLFAPSYRELNAEFLRNEFPRIPLADSRFDFEVLSGLGWQLVEAHLLKRVPRKGLAQLVGLGDLSVEKVTYAETDNCILINKTQRFAPVPPTVWSFQIGGYAVLDKYLKSRKGRMLSLDEINHVSAIADSVAFTVEQMAKIEDSYTVAFPDGG